MVYNPICAVVAPHYQHLFRKKLGMSATFVLRPQDMLDRDAVFNDDFEKFGRRPVDIDRTKAINLGWTPDQEVGIVPLPVEPEWRQSIEEKRSGMFNLGGTTLEMSPTHYVAIEGTRKHAIKIYKKTHILILASFTLSFNSSFLTKNALLPALLQHTKAYPFFVASFIKAFKDAP